MYQIHAFTTAVWAMMKFVLVAFLVIQSTNALSQSLYPQPVIAALQEAGSNRTSLEALLQQYKEKGEHEKFEAACYLIANMTYYAQEGAVLGGLNEVNRVVNHIDSVYYRLIYKRSAQEQESNPLHQVLEESARHYSAYCSTLNWEEPLVDVRDYPDITTLDAAFLSQHIDHVFALRDRNPFLKSMSLADFFEFVLPYRAFDDYPLVVHAADLAAIFQKYINPLQQDSVNALGACYNRVLWWLRHHGGQYPFESMIGWQELFFNGFHDCVDITNYATLIYRACGVPAISEYNIAYKIWEGRHFTTAIMWRDGKWYAHSPESELPDNQKDFVGCLNIYREHFARRDDTPFSLRADGERIPEEFNHIGLEDVSSHYLPVKKCTLLVPDSVCSGRNLVYLASFQKNRGLVPVTWGLINHQTQTATFNNVVDGNIYFPVYTDSHGILRPFTQPFTIFNGQMEVLPRTSGQCVHARLYRKYPRKPAMIRLAEETKGAVVLGANNPQFQDADTLAILSYVPDTRWDRLSLEPPHPMRAYQYYKVCAPQSHPHLRMAEIQFLTLRSHGYSNVTDMIEFARTDSEYVRLLDAPLSECSWKAEYDLNVQTAPEAYPDVTLKLSEPQIVDEVRFVIKHANNVVQHGHTYALFQWTDNGWQFVEKLTSHADYVEPSYPLEVGGIYWLSDIDDSKEELPFIIGERGEQIHIYYRVLDELDRPSRH